MAAVAAASGSEQAAALEPTPNLAPACPRATLDPQLFMAARRGDSKALKDLLQLKDDGGNDDQQGQDTRRDDEGSGTPITAAAASTTTSVAAAPSTSISQPHVIVEVDQRRPHADAVDAAPLPPPPVPVIEGESLLVQRETVEHVVEQPPPHNDDAAALPARQAPPAAGSPAPPVLVLDADGVTIQGDSLIHVVAACGDTQKFLECVDVIVRNKEKKSGAGGKRRALEARNNKGDTPLHCAAGAGNAHMISCLVDLLANTADDDEASAAAKLAFLRMQNECGETALHQAVRTAQNNEECIDRLMAVDPELACIPHDEEEGSSPLYLAISLGQDKIAQHLYDKSEGKLSYSGPDGRNALHAAVSRGQALRMILGWLEDVKRMSSGSSVAAAPDLLSQLTSQRHRQQKGSTPLHLAASLWGCQTAGLLLDANESTAYQADDQGSYPIHVAAWSGNLAVVKMLLERCPDCATLQDGQGRTFLHVAAEKRRYDVVRYVVWRMPHHLSRKMILNAQDSNGDTALHYAIRAGNLAAFNCLLRNRQVCLDVANKDRMTPLDLSWTMIPAGFQYNLNPRNMVRSSLIAAGATHGGGRPDLFFTEKRIPKRDVDKESKKHTEATQVMSIVTALIATVTFASAFTLPGGYRADGQPVLAGSYAFDAFILSDTLAFLCSIGATCTLVYAGLPAMDLSLRNWYFNVSAFLLQSAARSFVAAFGLGLYLVGHHTASTIAACAIVFASSLYGNMGAWRNIRMATTVLARIGIRRHVVLNKVIWILLPVLVHFGSYVIIFGLPAIRKRVH